ncbi:MAG TPA: AMP-binding protein [bacterium]|nr:AMP-binding protein [bacterium]HQI48011.1 AMP-binding protein [bacterium]HQJ64981.1 AMP-binding protein [bacterium]
MPENCAMVFGSHRIEYRRFYSAVCRLAAGLQSLGIQRGDRVALHLPNVSHFCISYYALLHIGAVVVPLNILSREAELTAILQHSGCRAIISWTGFTAQVQSALTQARECTLWLLLGDTMPRSALSLTQLIARSPEQSYDPVSSPDDLAVINYLAGSAEEALGAEFTHAALVASATTYSEMFRMTVDDRILAVLPLFHPLGQTLVMHGTFYTGATLVLQPRFVAAEVVAALRDHRITYLAAVPDMFKILSQLGPPDPPVTTLKYALSYGAQLQPGVVEAFEANFHCHLLEAYGFTEAGPLVTSARINRERKPGSSGLPLLGVEVRILNEEGVQLRPHQSGEIWVKSPSMMQGYHNKPDRTLQRLRDDWFFSGDIGYLDDEHYLFVQERKEDIITKGGFQIFSFEVEEILARHPAIAEAAVVGIPDPTQGQEVKAVLVLRPGVTLSRDELITWCREYLPVYKTPRYIEFVSALPKTTTGRILKNKLRSEAAHGKQ